jgi:ATP-binding cassette subfamily F protein uup
VAYLDQDHGPIYSTNLYQFVLGNEAGIADYKADIIFSQLEIDGNWQLDKLSGGQLRRAGLAKVLVHHPDILLLDEPTNHLDIKLIEWLEGFVKEYNGTVVCISHDRSFLTNVTNKVWWLDAGVVRKSDRGFSYFEQWQEEVVEQAARQLQKLSKKVGTEDDWLTYGVTARRKRNQKRLADLIEMREKLRNNKAAHANSKHKIQASLEDTKKSQFIIEAENIEFAYGAKKLINSFSFKVKKGEKIGIVGPNGVGKSTLLKMLTKELEPSLGKVKHGSDLAISYLDQTRSALDMNSSIKENLCPGGGFYLEVGNKTLHIASYLKQFLFDPTLLDTKICVLSGGQLARLLIAKMLIDPGNLLILDEPTNDLDLDTIEILLEILFDYSGTAIIVSHDRDFLDRLVSRTLVFADNGKIIEVVGGYKDYINIYNNKVTEQKKALKIKNSYENSCNLVKNKLSYNHQRELELLPQEIKTLESKICAIEELLSDETLFVRDNQKFNLLSQELVLCNSQLEEKINRWLELEN